MLTSRRPRPELRDQVRVYTGYVEEASSPRERRELPTGDVALIISFGPSLTIRDRRLGSVVERSSFVAGVHDGYVATQAPGFEYGIEARLTPTGAYTLLGVRMDTLANRAVALDDLLGDRANRLAERLSELPTWEARFDCLDDELKRLLQRGPRPSASTVWVCDKLVETSGRMTIGALVSELGCTRKHVAERFRREVGVPPKTLARVLRFNRATRLLRANNRSLSAIALECGYYDQAHFNRDFRDFAGTTPRDFASRFGPARANSVWPVKST
jgi:AraC-like DNA-binding protein